MSSTFNAGWRDRDLLLAADGIRGNASGIAFSCYKGDEKREERKGGKQRALGRVIPDNIAVCFAAYVSARVLRFAYDLKVKGAVMKVL